MPEVDRLAVRVVTDSYHHAFEASRTVGDVQLQRVVLGEKVLRSSTGTRFPFGAA